MVEKHKKTFHLRDGKTFANVKDFAKHLKNMTKDVYEHHVSDKKNDFHNWLKHSMKKEDLANKVAGKIDKIEMELHVLRNLLFEKAQNVVEEETKKVAKKVTKKASQSKKNSKSLKNSKK